MSVPGFLKGIQKDIGHTKTKLLQLAGTIDKTIDGEFEICRINLDDMIKFATNLQKDCQKFDHQIEEIIVDPIKSVAEDFSHFWANHPAAEQNTKGDLLDVSAWSNNSVNSYLVCHSDLIRSNLPKKKQAQFATHVKVALDRLQIKKVEKRDKILLDLDNNKSKLQAATEQNKQDARLETKCKELQQQYDHINSELKSQIAYEVDILDTYFIKELKLLHSRQREVYFAMSESFKTIMDAETLIQIGSGSFVVSTESQYMALAAPNPLPDTQSNNPPSEQPKAPNSPNLMGKLRTQTTRISSMVDKKPTSSSGISTASPSTTSAPATTALTATTTPPSTMAANQTARKASGAPTAPAQQPQAAPTPIPASQPQSTPVLPAKPPKPTGSSQDLGTPPKRPPPTPVAKSSTATAASTSPSPAPTTPQQKSPEPAPPQPQQNAPEQTAELDISEYHYDYTSGNASHSLISNEKRNTVANPRMSAMFDTFSTTNAFGNPKDFSGMFGSDNQN